MNRLRYSSVLACLTLSSSLSYAQEVDTAFDVQQQYQQNAQQSQLRVEALDDETLSMVSSSNRELESYEALLTYNENMRQLLASQEEDSTSGRASRSRSESASYRTIKFILFITDKIGLNLLVFN